MKNVDLKRKFLIFVESQDSQIKSLCYRLKGLSFASKPILVHVYPLTSVTKFKTTPQF